MALKNISKVRPKVWWGSAAANASGGAFIAGLPLSRVQGSRLGDFSFNCGSNEVGYIAFPTSYGAPTFRVGGAFMEGGLRSVGTYSVTYLGVTQDYDLYVTNQSMLGNFVLHVN